MTHQMTEFLERCADRLPALLSDLERMVCHESPSSDLAAVASSAELTAEIGQDRLGVVPDFVEIDGRTHLRWRFGTGRRRVLLLCHHDTVWPLGSLAEHPWSVEDGVLRGPGCFDMKTGTAMAFHALSLLAERNGERALNGVSLLVTGDEEIGSPTSRALIESEATGCVAALVLEPSGPAGALKTERKGTSMYELAVTGRAAHTGLEPERGINASIELAHQILAVSAVADVEQGTSVTPTVASAGTTLNTVPARALLKVDVRARTDAEQQRVDKEIRQLTPTLDGAELAVSGEINRPPLMAERSRGLFARARELAPSAGIPDLRGVAVGGASDGNFTAGIGISTLDGLGSVGGGAHADDEHVIVSEIPPRVALLGLLVADLHEAESVVE
jgi:glutamate carboxypeptidase